MSLSISGKSSGFHPEVSDSISLRDTNFNSAFSTVGSASSLGLEGRLFKPGNADSFCKCKTKDF